MCVSLCVHQCALIQVCMYDVRMYVHVCVYIRKNECMYVQLYAFMYVYMLHASM